MTVTAQSQSADRTTHMARPVAIWLLVICAMILVMVVLGGVTRLTHSGLSIVDWRPLLGWLPPLTDTAWQDAFTRYQGFPEYQKLNAGMTLAQFKSIYWLEYIHRLWGRSIGVVFLIPLLTFLATGRISKRLRPHLVVIFVLGGLQGVLGWYMVKSGMIDHPDVSQYRLAAHLGAAFLIYGYTLWIALKLLEGKPGPARGADVRGLARLSLGLVILVLITALSGAFVAGLDAGFTFNTFPLMDGRLVPDEMMTLQPWPLNFFENVITVQFTHRVLAITTFLCVTLFWLWAVRIDLPRRARVAIHVFMGLATLQVALGISTLLLVVPVPLAAAHQAGALLTFSAALWTVQALRHAAGPAPRQASPVSAEPT